MDARNENEPRRCSWRNPCCCQTIGSAVTAGAVLTILFCLYTALTLGGLAGIAIAATRVVQSKACETAKWTGIFIASSAIAMILPTLFLLCCRWSCMCVVWILCELSYGIWSIIASLKMSKAIGTCLVEAKEAVKDILPGDIPLDSDTFTPAIYANLGVLSLMTLWLTWLVSAFACYLRRNKVGAAAADTFNQDMEIPTSSKVEEVAMDLSATHSSRLLGYSPAAVHQPAEDLMHPEPAPGQGTKKRKFERWDNK